MNLSPLPVQKFFDNNGAPLAGGLLFTYVAGTTTKIATYTDSAGTTPNTNPVVLNFRGEAQVWISPSLAYKFVLCPANDTDPPGNPIWTVDNISIATGSLDNAGQDTGSANAIQITIPSLPSVPSAFTRIVWKSNLTNTGPVTISINGGITKALQWQNQQPISASAILLNGMYEAIYDGTAWQLQGPTLGPSQVRTADEVTAGVTPSDFDRLPLDDRRYATTADFIAVVNVSGFGEMNRNHTIAAPVTLANTAVIRVNGNRSITATASMTHMLRANGQLTIVGDGELLFDADNNVTVSCVWCTTIGPKLKNVRMLDSSGGIVTGSVLSTAAPVYGLTGDTELENVTFENCANIGIQAWGDATLASQAANLVFRNCKTLGNTGSGNFSGTGVGYLYHFAGFRSVSIEGGHFRGASTALLTSAFKCSTAVVQGGIYEGIGRGPTIGQETINFTVDGTVCRNMGSNAVSADTTTGVGSIAGIGVLSNNTANACGRAIRTTCSNVSVIGNKAYECTASGAAFAFGGSGTDIFVDGNSDFSATTSRVSYYVTETSQVKFGSNSTNATARQCYMVDTGSEAIFNRAGGVLRSMTANGDLTGNDGTIVVDATAGTVDIDLFDNTEVRATNFEFTILKVTTPNTVTLTFQGGAAHGETINTAASYTIPAGTRFRVRVMCSNGPNGTWFTESTPQAL